MGFEFDQKAFGRRMKAARKRADLTQDKLAEKFGITKSAVSQWESGSTLPDIRSVIALCRASQGNSADEILLGEAALRVSTEERQLLQLMRELPPAFRLALNEHINKQWELAYPDRVGPGNPYPKAKTQAK